MGRLISGAAVAGKRAKRNKDDAYLTPDAVALACAESLARAHLWANPSSILEPGCGGGAFLRAARATWPYAALRGVDLNPQCDGPGTVEKRDLFGIQTWGEYSLCIGNPAFLIAVPLVRHCLDLVHDGGHVAMLLPLSFLGGPEHNGGDNDRRRFWEELPLRALAQIMPRVPFMGGTKTAAQEYALMVWRKDFTGRGDLLPPIMWRDARAQTRRAA